MVEKWYSKYLNKFGLKLLMKNPKMENEMFVQSIVVNHPTFDTNFTTSCVYIVKTKGETLLEPGGLNDDYNPFNLGDFMYECKFQYAHE
jgi:hypothetical protein